MQNRPYGLFFWTDVAGTAFDRWENAHDGYGSFADLDAATVADVKAFFDTYYGPNNAVLAIVGDVTADEAFAMVEKYFGADPGPPGAAAARRRARRPTPQERPSRRPTRSPNVPAVAVGWKLPDPRHDQDDVPAAVLGELLAGGEASRLYQGLVKGKELLLRIDGGLDWPLGDAWTLRRARRSWPSSASTSPTRPPRRSSPASSRRSTTVAREGVPAAELERRRRRCSRTSTPRSRC